MPQKIKSIWLDEMAERSRNTILGSKIIIDETRTLIDQSRRIVAAAKSRRGKRIAARSNRR